jgi:2-succinyl-6-hydroxy-2,4-cyclohexadiene-1-carboxylate synthase
MGTSSSLGYTLAGHSGPLLLLLHGFLGSRDDWCEITDRLGPGFRTLAVDLPGHGMSTTVEGALHRMDNCAAALIDLLDDITGDPCHLIGYSMGGRLALYLAVTYPERFASVILESASPGLRTAEERAARRKADEALADRLEGGALDRFLKDWYAQPMFESLRANRPRMAELMARRRQNEPSALARSLQHMGLGMQPSLWDKLDKLKTPLLLLAGAKDRKFVGLARAMCDLCHCGQMRIIDDCGHNIHHERPAEYSRQVLEFLTTNKLRTL